MTEFLASALIGLFIAWALFVIGVLGIFIAMSMQSDRGCRSGTKDRG